MTTPSPKTGNPKSLSGLLPFLRPYRGRIALALLFLVLAAMATLAFPLALRSLIDGGLVQTDRGAQVMALREQFLGAVWCGGAARSVFGGALLHGELAGRAHHRRRAQCGVWPCAAAESGVFETHTDRRGAVALSADTTLVQTVVGSSLSMGLRNLVMGIGALAVLVWTNPMVMVQVLGVLVLIVLPAAWFGRRVRKLSRASQDRAADASAIAAEVLNAIPVVQSYTAEAREAARFDQATDNAFGVAGRRSRARSVLVASSSSPPRPRCCGACTRAPRR